MKSLIALVSAATMSFALVGCNSAPDLSTFITNVRLATVQACNFLPAIETITAIFTANASLPVAQVANAICKAVVTDSAHPGAAPPSHTIMVGDKVIHVDGKFME